MKIEIVTNSEALTPINPIFRHVYERRSENVKEFS